MFKIKRLKNICYTVSFRVIRFKCYLYFLKFYAKFKLYKYMKWRDRDDNGAVRVQGSAGFRLCGTVRILDYVGVGRVRSRLE